MAALLVVAALLPLGIEAWADLRGERQRLLANAAALLAARGDHLADELDTFHRGYQLAARKLGALPTVIELCQAAAGEAERLRAAVRGILAVYPAKDLSLRGAAILDLQGRVELATETRLEGLDLSRYGFVREALHGTPVISELFVAQPEVGSAPSIAYLAPVEDATHSLAGVAVLWVQAEALWNLARAANGLAGPDSYAVLFDDQGVRIAHTYSQEIVFHPGGLLAPAAIDAMVAERRFGARTRELLEQRRDSPEQFERARSAAPDSRLFRGFGPVNQKWNLGVGRRLATVPWTLFYMIPETSLEAPLRRLTREKLLFAAALILLSLIAGALFAGVILQPIRSLSAATAALADGDLAARVAVDRGDEIGRLGASFNAMAERIAAQAAALTGTRDDLEQRVLERTAELAATAESLQAEVAERRRAEAALRESERSLATTLDSIGDAVIATDVEGRVVRMNPVAEELTGWPVQDARGRPLAEVFSILNEETHLPVASPVARVLSEGIVVGLANHTLLRSLTGAVRPIADSGAPIRDAEGTIHGVVLVFRDRTEERRSEELRLKSARLEAENKRSEEANRLKSEFLANMSHELRTPLNAIIGFGELLHDGRVGPVAPDQKEFLGDILASARHLLRLINDVLDLSKVEAGKMDLHPERVDLENLVGEVRDILRSLAAARRIALAAAIDPGVRNVFLDPAKLKQVLYNYLSNALKFTAEEGQVTVRARAEEDGFFRLEVEDTGIGIGAEDLGRLFVEFQQLDTSPAKRFAGTGLGLALTKRIVEAQGGRVGVRSTPGVGSLFWAILPREARVVSPAG
jgi:PAS domain S-box-containing protein